MFFTGKYAVPSEKLQGAPPLFLIHSSGKEKSAKAKKEAYKWYEPVEVTDVLGRQRKIGAAYLNGLGADVKDEIIDPANAYEVNPFGFGVATSPNGSMTRELMLDFAVHFVKHLPDGSDGEPKQGKGGEAVILTLDGHISRWNMHALIHMLDNNVLPFFMPSHTSMWGQVNDNGANLSLEKHIQAAAATERMHRNTAPVSYHNRLIFLGVGTYIESEHRTLMLTGTNIAKHGHYICGLFPFNPYCINWTGAIATLGQREKILNEAKEQLKGWEIRVKDEDDINNFCELTTEQMDTMMEGYDGVYGDERDLKIVAMLRAQSILARWREQEMLRVKQKEMQLEPATALAAATEEQQQQGEEGDLPELESLENSDEEEESDPMQHVEGEAEQLAMELVEFVEATTVIEELGEQPHDIGPALPTLDEVTNTILTTTKQNKPVTLTHYSRGIEDEDGYIEGTAIKVGASEWMTCINGLPRGTILTSTELSDATKWMVHRPIEFLTSKENSVQMARIKRLDKCERGRMSEEAKKMCRLDREARKREEFENMKRKVLTGRYSFHEFKQVWKVAEDPFTQTYQIYNRRTKETEQVKAVIKGNEESATSMLVLESLAKVMQSKNTQDDSRGGPPRKKQRLGVVATILGEDPFVALNKLQRDARVCIRNDDEGARKKLTDEYNELNKNYEAFQKYAEDKRVASGVDDLDLSIVSAALDKSKGLDHYLRLFYPKSGVLSKNLKDKEDYILNGDQDGRHDFKLTSISIDYKLQTIARHLEKLQSDIAEGQPEAEAQANENEEGAEEHALVDSDDGSVMSMELDLEGDDDIDGMFGDTGEVQL